MSTITEQLFFLFLCTSFKFVVFRYRVVCFDDDNEIFFDVVLTKVDVRWSAYGLNVFYKLQVNPRNGLQFTRDLA